MRVFHSVVIREKPPSKRPRTRSKSKTRHYSASKQMKVQWTGLMEHVCWHTLSQYELINALTSIYHQQYSVRGMPDSRFSPFPPATCRKGLAFRPLRHGIYPILDKHDGQRNEGIQMTYPMNQMANNDRPVQSACLFYDIHDIPLSPKKMSMVCAWRLSAIYRKIH